MKKNRTQHVFVNEFLAKIVPEGLNILVHRGKHSEKKEAGEIVKKPKRKYRIPDSKARLLLQKRAKIIGNV